MLRSRSPALLAALPLAACGGTWVQIPPAIDLAPYEILGVIEFASEAEGEIAPYTTNSFIEQMRSDQGMIRIVELGPEQELLSALGLDRLDREAFQRIGDANGLATIVAGRLDISDVRPTVHLSPSLGNISAAADVDAKLSVRMIEVASGASIWNRTAEATRRVGRVSLRDGRIRFDAADPDRAYGELVQVLVEQATVDFKATWEKR